MTRSTNTITSILISIAALLTLGGCAAQLGTPGETGDFLSYEQFRSTVYQEPWSGNFIVNGDEVIRSEDELHGFYDRMYENWLRATGQLDHGGATTSGLIVHQPGGGDSMWNATESQNIRYCVSNAAAPRRRNQIGGFGTGSQHAAVVAAMAAATGAWEEVANVRFVYDSSQDGSCDSSNNSVDFDVSQVDAGGQYLARAFFPESGTQVRDADDNVLIDPSSFGDLGVWTLTGILRHELGHALGFRHEHTRPESGTCFEDNNWRELTAYDSSSVMHYPQCNGTQTGDLVITACDAAGAAALYGAGTNNAAYGECGGVTPPPPPPSGDGTYTEGSDGPRSISRRQWVQYAGLSVVPGTPYTVAITGSGDADLYVNFGSSPSASTYVCRPYLAGSNESCSGNVPSGQTELYIGVYGYRSGTYTLNASWYAP